MSILTDLLGAGATAASGGLFGLFGSAIGVVGNYFVTRQQNAFEEKKWSHELELQKLQSAAKKEETESEMSLVAEKGRWDGLVASINQAAQEKSNIAWVEAVKSLMRPTITFILLAYIGYILAATHDATIQQQIIEEVNWLAASSVAWWFGDRAPQMLAKKR